MGEDEFDEMLDQMEREYSQRMMEVRKQQEEKRRNERATTGGLQMQRNFCNAAITGRDQNVLPKIDPSVYNPYYQRPPALSASLSNVQVGVSERIQKENKLIIQELESAAAGLEAEGKLEAASAVRAVAIVLLKKVANLLVSDEERS